MLFVAWRAGIGSDQRAREIMRVSAAEGFLGYMVTWRGEMIPVRRYEVKKGLVCGGKVCGRGVFRCCGRAGIA